jgi:hypothetical protein
VNRGSEQASIPIIGKFNLRPFFQNAFNSGAETMIRQQTLGNPKEKKL